jgi:hypothetical protein
MRRGRGVRAPVGRPQRQAEQAGARLEQGGVAREHELEGPVEERGGERELGTDAGGLAGRDDDAARLQGFLIST